MNNTLFKMTYPQFKDWLLNNTRDYLPKEYENAKISIKNEVTDYSDNVEALKIETEGMKDFCPQFAMKSMYKEYAKGISANAIMRKIVSNVVRNFPANEESWILDYERAKSRIFFKAVNANDVGKSLDNIPHEQYGDIVLVYQLKICDDITKDNGNLTITDGMMEQYGVSEDELKKVAVQNTELLKPLDINMYKGYLPCLNSIESLFYPDVMKTLQEEIGDYYALPISKNEWMLVGDTGLNNVQGMQNTLNKSNEKYPNDAIANSIFLYSGFDDSFELVESPFPKCERSIGF